MCALNHSNEGINPQRFHFETYQRQLYSYKWGHESIDKLNSLQQKIISDFEEKKNASHDPSHRKENNAIKLNSIDGSDPEMNRKKCFS